jgi:hypothetical protein
MNIGRKKKENVHISVFAGGSKFSTWAGNGLTSFFWVNLFLTLVSFNIRSTHKRIGERYLGKP